MAYQAVGTPRFFIDHGLWQHSIGSWVPPAPHTPLIQLNPTRFKATVDAYTSIPKAAPITYMAFLGIDETMRLYPTWYIDGSEVGAMMGGDDININGGNYETAAASQSDESNISHSGWCLTTFQDNDSGEIRAEEIRAHHPFGGYIGAISAGSHFTLPHSADLSVTLSYEYEGIKTIETKGGASLSNSFYYKQPMWGGLPAWELAKVADFNQYEYGRSGRKIWSLSFSYLDDGDIFGSNQALDLSAWATQIADGTPPASAFDTDPPDLGSDNSYYYNLLTDDNFFSQVINRVHGSRNRFIFQPDSNDNTNFAICKFDMKNFSFKQVANGVYNMKLKIREVW